MKKFIKTIFVISSLNLLSCSTNINTPQVSEILNGDRAGESSILTLSKINDNFYNFSEEIQRKDGVLIRTGGTITLDKNEVQFRYTKPGVFFVIATQEISNDGKTYTYEIKNSDTTLSIAGQKYIYKKN
ncbi:MAG: hypothetical protein U0354_11630 [Candidatus Sericytochromatia bacterium]